MPSSSSSLFSASPIVTGSRSASPDSSEAVLRNVNTAIEETITAGIENNTMAGALCPDQNTLTISLKFILT